MRYLAAALLLLSVCANARTIEPVQDNASLLTVEQKANLTSALIKHNIVTSIQIVVATTSSLDGNDIAEFALQYARSQGIGQKGKDNGLLLLLAPNERKVRIEAGYGLESNVTDAASHEIIEHMKPYLAKKRWYEGLSLGVNELISITKEN